jgi:diadenosine tetraphosphate (Ap4A) HIT family hydrolase
MQFQQIRDVPLTQEEINIAQNNLDRQRFVDNQQFQYYQPLMQYPSMLEQLPPPPPPLYQFAPPPQFAQWGGIPPLVDLKLIRKVPKKDRRCYTCKPRGKVKKHMINVSESGLFTFHFDMHKRPVIIMTPIRHMETILEMTPEELNGLFKSIKEFTSFWKIEDYQISFNVGSWQNHEHFHCKIRISEKIINRMRRDHFNLIKREEPLGFNA